MLACHTIAGEIKDGSIRYMAIRPVSRTELYFGKLLAIVILTSILIVFSGVVSLIVGGIIYGFNTFNILTIFNGSTAIVIHPIIMMLIFLFSLIIESVII
jgi:ABC-2 type transport system permease protein